jgi:hypothetical protein
MHDEDEDPVDAAAESVDELMLDIGGRWRATTQASTSGTWTR